jgi:hypothetical protein
MTRDDEILPRHQAIARHLATVFGGEPRVADYADAAEARTVGILSAVDRPGPGVTAYSTIRLSDHPLREDGVEFPARIELAGACDSRVTTFPNLLASAAFQISGEGVLYRPGAVIPDLVRSARVSSSLPHLYLTAPFLWGHALDRFEFGTTMITWLMGIPIAETELSYLQTHGDSAFETLLEEHRVDIFNVDRGAVA